MVYPHNNSMHSCMNNDYGIPIAAPYSRDVEMTETSFEQPVNKSRSKRILHYRQLEPQITEWVVMEKKRIGLILFILKYIETKHL